MNELKRNACKRLNEQIKTDFITRIKSHSVPPAQTHRDPRCDPPCRASPSSLSPPSPPRRRAYLQEPVASLADEREAHGSFGHGELAVFIPRGRPSELPELLGDG